MTFTDTQLQDYLAGRLDADLASALEESIADNLVLEKRLLKFERAGSANMREALHAMPIDDRLDLIRDAMPNPETTGVAMPTRSRWSGAIGAAVAAAAVAGVVMFNGGTATASDRWQEQVAIYQALYVTDTLAVVQANPGDVAGQLARSGEILGRALPIDAVGDLDGLPLLRAQVLGFDDHPLIQMAYLTDDGVPVALCAIRLGAETDGVTSETLAGLSSVHWSDGTFSYMIVGDIAPDRLLKMANDVQGVL